MQMDPEIKVVVVEDSPLFLAGLVSMLRDIPSVKVVGIANSAESALDLIHETQPDLCFLDVSLAAGTGLDVLSSMPKEAPPRTVVMTNSPSEELRSRCSALGAAGFVDKKEILEWVTLTVEGVSAGRRTRAAASALN